MSKSSDETAKEVEGVIKFHCDHDHGRLEPIDIGELSAWRDMLKQLGLLGQDPLRYGGYGFGNVSMRTAAGFLVSGTQTGELDNAALEAYAEVIAWNLAANRVTSRGMTRPSSESLTHAAIYSLNPDIRWVFHVHSPDIWNAAPENSLPTTPSSIEYGTQEMADAVSALFDCGISEGVFAMGGHEDGIISFGTTAESAGSLIVSALASSRAAQ